MLGECPSLQGMRVVCEHLSLLCVVPSGRTVWGCRNYSTFHCQICSAECKCAPNQPHHRHLRTDSSPRFSVQLLPALP